jgi:CubicO group peptidase (beta-lactamase class C family)
MGTSIRQHTPRPAGSRHRRPVTLRRLAAALACWLALAAPAAAAEPVAGPAAATDVDAAGIATSVDEIATYIAEAFPAAMAEHGAPGGVFVLVADGEIAIAEGFGRTSLFDGVPVDPARTRFDVGSVAKLFTATAVMQQVERGHLDLEEDVNVYLRDLEVPATYPEPVTTANLLTHTAGFAEHFLVGMWADGPGAAEPLVETLARHQPARIRPPGVAHQYSNYGMSLAGHLVEVVSGESFEDHVTGQILRPLGMDRTSYGRPAADSVDVVPHSSMVGPTAPLEPAYINWLPAGGLWTTGEDMAAFLLAHLQGGAHGDARILEPATVEAMQTTRFAPNPDVAGLGYGFFIDRHGGVQHGGGWAGAGAHVYLRPDLGIGMFTAFNHDDGPLMATRLHDELAERYLPARASATTEVTATPAAAVPAAEPGAYAGDYRWNRHDRSSFASVFSTLLITRMKVTEHPDGAVSTTMGPAPFIEDARWLPSGAGVFVEEGGTNVLAFDLDRDGRAVGLHVMGAQLFSMERVGWTGTPAAVVVPLLVTLAVLLVAAIGWPAGALVRRLRRRGTSDSSGLRPVRRLSGLAAGVGAAFVLGLTAHFATDMAGMFQVGPALRGLLWLPLAAVGLTAGLAVLVVRMWRRRDGRLPARVYHSVVLVALLGFLPLLHSLRLLGFHH